MDYELLSSSVTGALELLWVKLGPGAATREAAASHTAEECTVVTRGSAIAEIGGRRIVLEEGDSVTIGSGLPHRFLNETSTDTELLLAMSPSTF